MEQKTDKIRVVCAMSGGVDSSVAAVLLKKAGFEVVGVFMKFWTEMSENGVCLPENRCCSSESEQRARKTALQIGIPFYVLNASEEFKKSVVDRFVTDTRAGLTPNPCVICNQEIKFGLLIDKALEMGADYVATGHYCQIKKDRGGSYHLLKGKDKDKDQSYFLWRLNQKQLGRIIFPVGCFDKTEVRALAKRWRLPSAQTPESQEVCFVSGDMEGFLARHCGKDPGDIVDEAGNILGRHEGLWFYTIGQRKGIKLSGGPFYVSGKNFAKNRLIVAKSPADLKTRGIVLGDVRWVGQAAMELPLKIRVKIRYRATGTAAILDKTGNNFVLKFEKPQFAPAAGQSAVFYKGNEVLGGGIITSG